VLQRFAPSERPATKKISGASPLAKVIPAGELDRLAIAEEEHALTLLAATDLGEAARFRRGVLEAIDIDTISAHGYAFQIETTYRALRAGFRVVEIPIVFSDRVAGGSKMGKRIVLEAIWKVPVMRLGRWRPHIADNAGPGKGPYAQPR
jgi:hypothetical protein